MKDLLNFVKDKKKIIIVFIIVIIIVLLILFRKNTSFNDSDEVKLSLFGLSNITLNYGEEYVEPGFYAINSSGKIITDEVVVYNGVNVYEPGIYKITYKLGSKTIERIVEVLEKEETAFNLTLVGLDVVTLNINDKYNELGFIATDSKGNSLNDQVVVSGIVDTTKEGSYKLVYSLNVGGVKKEVERVINVINNKLNISLSLNTLEYTNSNLILSINVIGNEFSTLVLPNSVISDKSTYEYEISLNGTYKVVAYNNNGDRFEKSIVVSNIDKKEPSATCNAILYTQNTNIEVLASDDLSQVSKYIYYDNSIEIDNSSNKTLNYNKKLSENISVKVYDFAGNYKFVTCNVIDKSYLEPITPKANENIVKKSETDTLKVYITKKNKYYITRIWAYDPYNQLNKFDSPEYGKNLYRPKVLLEKAINNYNLSDKLIVGFNASGFYLKDTYDASSVSKYSNYNKTSVGTLVITNGKVIRNWYQRSYKTWFTLGIDKNNVLRIFKDVKGTSSEDIAKKKIWADEVISSGIRNTYTFASPLVENGINSTTTTSMPSISSRVNRQAICQVNKNNFVLITGEELNRNDLISIMLSLGCQTGANLDGGGSIALLYKDKNTKSITTIIGNKRNLTEVGYFTE